jgi:predicted nucleic acid-binding protein
MIAIDTNLIVRYLTGDHPEQSPRARAIIDDQAVFVGITVLLEVEWVLRSAYGYRPADVVRALRAFAGLPTVSIEDATAISTVFDLVEQGIDMADALHVARATHCAGFLTFDRGLIKAARLAGHDTVREP